MKEHKYDKNKILDNIIAQGEQMQFENFLRNNFFTTYTLLLDFSQICAFDKIVLRAKIALDSTQEDIEQCGK